MSERRPNLPRLPCFMRSNLPTIPSPTTHRCPWVVVWFPDHRAYRRKSAVRAVCIYARRPWRLLGFAYWGAGSPQRQAESSSSSYGLVVHLQLLSTPPRGDAVTFSYKAQTMPWQGLSPCKFDPLASAPPRRFTGGSASLTASPRAHAQPSPLPPHRTHVVLSECPRVIAGSKHRL